MVHLELQIQVVEVLVEEEVQPCLEVAAVRGVRSAGAGLAGSELRG